MTVIDETTFDTIREDYRISSFETLETAYCNIDREILRKILSAHDYEEFSGWVDEARIMQLL